MAKCGKCGVQHVATRGGRPCVGHVKKRDGGRCTRTAMNGQDVCPSHGGRAPQSRAAAARRTAEDRAEKVMRRFGGPIDTTPTEALLDAVKWTAGYVAWLRDKVASITSDEKLVWGQTRNKVGGEDRGVTYESGKNAWLALLGEWHDRLVKICAAAIGAGIEERRVRLAESQGQLVADVIKAILADLKLSPEQQADVAEVVPRHLRLLMGGAA